MIWASCYLEKAGNISKGGFIIIKGRPCQVVEVSTSETDGVTQCYFVATDIFTSKTLENTFPSSHDCEVPVVDRRNFIVTGITEDGIVNLFGADGLLNDDLKLPTDEALQTQLKSGLEEGKDMVVSVMSSMEEDMIYAVKEGYEEI